MQPMVTVFCTRTDHSMKLGNVSFFFFFFWWWWCRHLRCYLKRAPSNSIGQSRRYKALVSAEKHFANQTDSNLDRFKTKQNRKSYLHNQGRRRHCCESLLLWSKTQRRVTCKNIQNIHREVSWWLILQLFTERGGSRPADHFFVTLWIDFEVAAASVWFCRR